MRGEEIATTRWDAISEDGQRLTVIGKGTKTRRLPLHDVTLEASGTIGHSKPDEQRVHEGQERGAGEGGRSARLLGASAVSVA